MDNNYYLRTTYNIAENMKKNGLYIFLLFIISCNLAQDNESDKSSETLDSVGLRNLTDSIAEMQIDNIIFDSIKCGLNLQKGVDYQNSKNKISQLKSMLNEDYSKIKDSLEKERFLDSVMTLFSAKLLNEIIPYWYGTEWDFNGYTSKPNEGKIACGYFVSTTLRDMGLKLNRYKLAQQGPENEAKTISILNKNMLVLDITDHDNISELFKEINEGLYFVGLDFHVGYFYKRGNENYFIHSNYIDGEVMIEVAENSRAFKSSTYYLSKISSNKEIALKWIQNKEINIIK